MEKWSLREATAMDNLLLFAGTTEGREIVHCCAGLDVAVYACVATEYGQALLGEQPNLTVLAGRKTADDMIRLIEELSPRLVIDATHPYAQEVTANIRLACSRTGTEYLRLLRQSECGMQDCVFVPDTRAAAEYLAAHTGNVLLTTGSKELAAYTALPHYQERLYARVLPVRESIEHALSLGFSGRNLICMQGPFSRELNAAMLRSVHAHWLVTKDTGEAGGFEEKLLAAKDAGAKVLVIHRPVEEDGVSLSECRELLARLFAKAEKKEIIILGAGPGAEGLLTGQAAEACRRAQLLIGAPRVVQSLSQLCPNTLHAILPGEIAQLVEQSPYQRIVIAMSGDIGFYSGAKKLLPLLEKYSPVLLPGISSVIYFCSRLGVGWEDAVLCSSHGRSCNYIAKIHRSHKVLLLSGGSQSVRCILETLTEYGLGDVRVSVGENLSYPNEKITVGTAQELSSREFDPLALLLVENPCPHHRTPGLPDEAFLRGEIPMTKSEVRAVTLSKLALSKDAVCWDVGAGTGSVALEMAIAAEDGMVFAVECNAAACALIEQNKRHLGVANLSVVPGLAPEALQALDAPTHVFIGGSKGNLKGIVQAALLKNPHVRIVINTVTAESFAEAVSILKELPVREVEILQISAARSRKAGAYHLMTAQNPIFLFSCTGGETDAT